MAGADVPQLLQIALRRDQNAGRSRHRLHDHRGHRLGAVQREDAFEIIGQMRAGLRLAAGKGVLAGQMGVGQMIDPREHRAENLAVVDDAADRDAAEIHPVIAAFAPDQPHALPLAPRAMIGNSDFQCRFNAFRAGVRVKYMRHPRWRNIDDPVRQFEGAGMAHLEGRRIIHLGGLALDGLCDPGPAMARVAAPQPRRPVEDLPPVGGGVMHPLGLHEHPRRLLELAVRGKRHPEGAQVVGGRGGGGRGGGRGGGAVEGHGGLPVPAPGRARGVGFAGCSGTPR